MNELLRTVVAGGVGAIVATTVLAGPPAVAGHLAKAAVVTSAMIKDGTIKPKDLNGKVKASLRKADTALQQVPNNAVTNPKLADNAVTNFEIADGSVFAAEVATNAIRTAELAEGAVTSPDLAADAVTQAAIANGAVGSAEVADNTLGAADLGNDAAGQAELAPNAVGASEVQDGSLNLQDIADAAGSVTVDFGNIGTGACVNAGPFATGVDLTDAIVLVENDVNVTGAVQIHARQAAPGFTSFLVIACNDGGAFDPPSANLTWAVLRFG